LLLLQHSAIPCPSFAAGSRSAVTAVPLLPRLCGWRCRPTYGLRTPLTVPPFTATYLPTFLCETIIPIRWRSSLRGCVRLRVRDGRFCTHSYALPHLPHAHMLPTTRREISQAHTVPTGPYAYGLFSPPAAPLKAGGAGWRPCLLPDWLDLGHGLPLGWLGSVPTRVCVACPALCRLFVW